MRLLNTETLQLEQFDGDGGPKASYAILSHTWGDDEVSFQDMMQHTGISENRQGFSKILGCCAKARSEGYRYVWIDTCCIDKSSSAELSEAINSMFKWYQDAEVCYAFLSDVSSLAIAEYGLVVDDDRLRHKATLSNSRWFTRGWTLQELLAPLEVVFCDSSWDEIGTRETLSPEITEITGIDEAVLKLERSPAQYSVAQRMSWASARNTTRVEDEAYCLMGLFDVNMPLLYGEGRKAFKRLQLEIMRQSTDRSILTWASPDSHGVLEGVLAPAPAMFEDCGSVEWGPLSFEMTTSPEEDNQLNRNVCHDIIGFSLRMEAGVMEPPRSGRGVPMVFKEYWDVTDDEINGDGAAQDHDTTNVDNDGVADFIHFPRDVGELYTHERPFREFDYGFLRHKGRTVVLTMLDGCTKRDGNNEEYTVGITLCLDADGLMKRVHFPSRFLIPEPTLFRSRVQTLHAALSGTEVLQQPPLPNWTKCMVRLPDNLADLPYELAYTIPAMANNAAGCWYLERWGETTDYATFRMQPSFSLHRTGTGRAMAFYHKTDHTLSFLLIFTLVKNREQPRGKQWIQVGIVQ
ncbi:heterokaryon incompatibility protein-domain-containing protein, partial [Apodospora peruviana]